MQLSGCINGACNDVVVLCESTYLLLHLVRMHKCDESIVGGVAQDAPGVPPGKTLPGVEYCALGARQVLLKVLFGVLHVPARQSRLHLIAACSDMVACECSQGLCINPKRKPGLQLGTT